MGRLDESEAEGKRALELDPLAPAINMALGKSSFLRDASKTRYGNVSVRSKLIQTSFRRVTSSRRRMNKKQPGSGTGSV